jgi:hypothetical protein
MGAAEGGDSSPFRGTANKVLGQKVWIRYFG